MYPFTHQAMVPNGRDAWLARIMTAGNFYCRKPNGSLFLSNMGGS